MSSFKKRWRLATVMAVLAVGGLFAAVAAACGGDPEVVRVVETVVVEKQLPGETVRVVETVVVERPVTRTERVVETVVVEKQVEGQNRNGGGDGCRREASDPSLKRWWKPSSSKNRWWRQS